MALSPVTYISCQIPDFHNQALNEAQVVILKGGKLNGFLNLAVAEFEGLIEIFALLCDFHPEQITIGLNLPVLDFANSLQRRCRVVRPYFYIIAALAEGMLNFSHLKLYKIKIQIGHKQNI